MIENIRKNSNLRNLRGLPGDDAGTAALQYALVGAIVFGAIIVAVGYFGGFVGDTFERVESTIETEQITPVGASGVLDEAMMAPRAIGLTSDSLALA